MNYKLIISSNIGKKDLVSNIEFVVNWVTQYIAFSLQQISLDNIVDTIVDIPFSVVLLLESYKTKKIRRTWAHMMGLLRTALLKTA